MILEQNHPAINDASFWQDQLNNAKILLAETQTALLKLMRGEIQEYTIDTGQNRQTVKRTEIEKLAQFQNSLIA